MFNFTLTKLKIDKGDLYFSALKSFSEPGTFSDLRNEPFFLITKNYDLALVRCPKWLFDKFNILEFKRGAEWGCQRAKGPTDYKV